MLITKKYMNIVTIDEYTHTDFVEREWGVIKTTILINDGDVYITIIDAKDVDEDFNPIDVKELRYFIKLYESGEVHFTFNLDEGEEIIYHSITEMIDNNEAAHDMMNRHDYRHLFGDGLEMVSTIFEEYNSLHG